MNVLEAITEANPKETHEEATTAEAARWLANPDAPEPPSQLSLLLDKLEESDAPTCRNCGTLMRRAGTCHTCPDCGETSGCA